jgi:hypothetical protein
VDARLFERIRRMQERFDVLCQRIEAGYSQVSETEGLAEIDALVKAERQNAMQDFGRLATWLSGSTALAIHPCRTAARLAKTNPSTRTFGYRNRRPD